MLSIILFTQIFYLLSLFIDIHIYIHIQIDTYTDRYINIYIDFVPTPKNYNKKQLDNDAENFFRLIKLRAHFKDINPKSNID